MGFFRDVSKEVVTGLVGTFLGFLGKIGFDFILKNQRDRLILRLLGFPKGKVLIIHSALFDETRDSYNYPSCDMISARRIANLLESVSKKEGIDFTIIPEANYLTPQGFVNPEVLKYNLILLGGPKRNKVTGEVLENSAKMRYEMSQDATGQNHIYDSITKHSLISSRDKLETVDNSIEIKRFDDEGAGYDYGLIMSMPNPLHRDRGVLLVAGIHGPGTVGAATYLSSKKNLSELARTRKGGVIQEVIYVKYDLETENVIEVSMI